MRLTGCGAKEAGGGSPCGPWRELLGTTTPTLYKRVRDKDDLLRLLQQRARRNLYSTIKSSPTTVDACRKALEYFEAHPHEFQLITEDWATAFAQREPMPSLELLKEHLAHELGGNENDHISLALAIVALLIGTATMLHAGDIHDKIYRHFRQVYLAACETLIGASPTKNHPRRGRRSLKAA
jgi:AcrR family transcriptional regulator